MATATNKVPPQLSNFKSYSDWVRMVNIWTKFTDLNKTKQGPAVVMSLSGKALESILELEDGVISSENGVKKILDKIDTIYKKDELHEKFLDLESFESYKRTPEMGIHDFLIEFDQRYNKLRKHQTTMTDDLLGFKLLKAANLNSQHEQLIKATITAINYENIKKKIKSIFSFENEIAATEQQIKVKSEPTFYTKEDTSEEDGEFENNDTEDSEEPSETYYTFRNFNKKYRSKTRPKQKQFGHKQQNYPGSSSTNWRSYPTPKAQHGKKNP